MTSAVTLGDRLAALAEAVDLTRGRSDPALVAEAAAVVHKAGERFAVSESHTVVALAGATGSGKSTLFNALSQPGLSAAGVLRPTTPEAVAVGWGASLPQALLDWLGVPRRHLVADADAGFGDLILLDLPDYDSINESHRREVDRLVTKVDMLVWVVDPQKYADAALHAGYLRPLAVHADVMCVVLNQIDLLSEDQRARCMADLRRLMDEDGLSLSQLLAVSAATGAGLDGLRDLMRDAVAQKSMAAQRLSGDVKRAASRLRSDLGGSHFAEIDSGQRQELVEAAADIAGVPVVVDAVRESWERRGTQSTGWPVLTWVSKLRPDPLRRLRLLERPQPGSRLLPRTSLPPASPVQRARYDQAFRELVAHVTEGLSAGWSAAVKERLREVKIDVDDAMDAAIAGVDLRLDRKRSWWLVLAGLQWLLLASLLSGIAWFATAWVVAATHVGVLPQVTFWGLPVPLILLAKGGIGGPLLGWLSRLLVRADARRLAAEARLDLVRAVAAVIETQVIDPIGVELDRRSRAIAALRRAA